MARPVVVTEEEILARARPLFVDQGYGVRTKQIAAAVGLTWAAIAARFGSKRALFVRAMVDLGGVASLPGPGDDCSATLPEMLERLRVDLWARWPLRLQHRLAGASSSPDEQSEGLQQRLAAALEAHARLGSVRSDIRAEDLARAVLVMVTGDVARRFVARERTLATDPTFIAGVVRLLSSG